MSSPCSWAGRGRSDVEPRPLAGVEVAGRGVRVEAELVCCSPDQGAWEYSVERRPSGERPVQERDVCAGLRGWDERLRTSRRSEQGCVDTRRRREARTRHAPDERQLVPRSPRAAEHGRRPDSGPLRGEPPLHDRVELRERQTRVPEQASQDRRSHCERKVCDDGERLVGQAERNRVALHHLDARIVAEARPQPPERVRVELDRADASTRVRKSPRQHTAAGAEIQHQRAGHDTGVADDLVGEGAATKRVATAWPRLR